LRDTTPDFERRWTELKRRLRTEPVHRRHLYGARWWWTILPLGAALVILALVLRPHYPADKALPADEVTAFADLLELDAQLRDAVPLANLDTTETLLLIPTSDLDHS